MHAFARWPRFCSTGLGAALLCLAGGAVAQVSEADLKAAFAYNFASFTVWPPDSVAAGDRLYFCVPATSPLRAALVELIGKPVNGHPLDVLVLPADAAIDRRCRVVVAAAIPPLPSLDGVLTIADGGQIGENGAIITLGRDGLHLYFDIDDGAARRAHLTLSSQLLRLARTVR